MSRPDDWADHWAQDVFAVRRDELFVWQSLLAIAHQLMKSEIVAQREDNLSPSILVVEAMTVTGHVMELLMQYTEQDRPKEPDQ